MRLVAIGLAAGIFSALFGIGGGTVAVPLLILLARLPARVATATSLGAIAITAVAGVVVYGIRGDVDVPYAALIGAPAVAGALLGTSLQQRLTTATLFHGSDGLGDLGIRPRRFVPASASAAEFLCQAVRSQEPTIVVALGREADDRTARQIPRRRTA